MLANALSGQLSTEGQERGWEVARATEASVIREEENWEEGWGATFRDKGSWGVGSRDSDSLFPN